MKKIEKKNLNNLLGMKKNNVYNKQRKHLNNYILKFKIVLLFKISKFKNKMKKFKILSNKF